MAALPREFRRLHPLTMVHRVGAGVLAFGIMALSSDNLPKVWIILAIAYGVFLMPWLIAQYVRFTYHVTEREIFIHSGVLSRTRRNIPVGRIQNVAIERNVLARLLGTAAVKIETAGSTKAEGALEFVSVAEAYRIRTLLRSGEIPAIADGSGSESPPAPDFSMPVSRVLLSGAYQFSLVYFAVVFSIFGQAQQFGLLGPEQLTNWLFADLADRVMSGLLDAPVLLGASIAIVAVLLGWLTGIVVNLLKFFRFRLELRPEKIYRRYGLATLREGTLPYGRVQSLVISSNPLMRLRQWFRLDMQTLGYQGSERGFQPAMPFAKWTDIMSVAPRIRSFSLPAGYERVARVTIRRMAVRYSLSLLLIVGAVYYFWHPAVWGLALLPFLWALAVLQYHCHGWAYVDDNLIIRRGAVRQRLWIVPAERFQAFQTSATFFQRHLGVCSLTVDTAGAGILRYPKIVDLPAKTADSLTYILYDAFQHATAPTKSEQEAESLV